MVEIFDVKERIIEDNDAVANGLRDSLNEKGVYMINLMGSPGAGKTTTLLKLISLLKDEFRIAVMEADVDSDVDARTVAETGVRVIQLHTGGLCHMDADMTRRGLERMGLEDLDVVVLENIGNLVCPAEFDTGAHLKLTILSVPEGDDKPLKYPLMFTVTDCLLINKIDTAPVFDFDIGRCRENVARLNDKAAVFPVSALTGEGFDEAAQWIREKIRTWRNCHV